METEDSETSYSTERKLSAAAKMPTTSENEDDCDMVETDIRLQDDNEIQEKEKEGENIQAVAETANLQNQSDEVSRIRSYAIFSESRSTFLPSCH